MSKGLFAALALSLGVNIFFGGFVAGRMLGGPRHPPFDRGPHEAGAMMAPDLKALSPQGRTAFRAVFEAAHETLRDRHRTLRERRAAFAAALAADPFDPAQAKAALVDLHSVTGEQQAAFATLMIDAVEKLSADDRRALAKSIADGSHWGGRRGERRHGDFPPPPPEDNSD